MEEEKVNSTDELNFEDDESDKTEPEPKGKGEEGNGSEDDGSKKQTSKENREWKTKRLLKEQYLKGKIDAIKVNPFTNEEIKTERDLELYEEMCKENNAGDTNSRIIGGYKSYFKKMNEKETESEKNKKIQEEQIASFTKAVPDARLREKILNDEDFKNIYGSIIVSGGDLGKAATSFIKLKKLDKPDPNYLKGKSETNYAPNPNETNNKPHVDFENMSDDEIKSAFAKTFGN